MSLLEATSDVVFFALSITSPALAHRASDGVVQDRPDLKPDLLLHTLCNRASADKHLVALETLAYGFLDGGLEVCDDGLPLLGLKGLMHFGEHLDVRAGCMGALLRLLLP